MTDTLRWMQDEATWTPDCDGIIYTRVNAPISGNQSAVETDKFHFFASFYHKMGTDQKEDRLVYFNEKYPAKGQLLSFTDD